MLLHTTRLGSINTNGFRNMISQNTLFGAKNLKPIKKHNPNQKFFITGSPLVLNSKNIQKLETISFFLQGVSPLISKAF